MRGLVVVCYDGVCSCMSSELIAVRMKVMVMWSLKPTNSLTDALHGLSLSVCLKIGTETDRIGLQAIMRLIL